MKTNLEKIREIRTGDPDGDKRANELLNDPAIQAKLPDQLAELYRQMVARGELPYMPGFEQHMRTLDLNAPAEISPDRVVNCILSEATDAVDE